MLSTILRLLGFDLEQHVARLKAHIGELGAQAAHQVREEIKDLGPTIGLAVAGAAAAVATLVIALSALYLWIEMYNGPIAALGVVGLITAVVAALLLALAFERGKRTASREPPRAPQPLPRLVPVPAPLNLSTLVSPPPHNASILDILTHRVHTRAAAASDETIEAAADVLRTGSTRAVFGTLAVAAFIGVLIGRRQ